MRKVIHIACVLSLSTLLAAQSKRLWVLRGPGEAVEYDSATFAEKQTVKTPPEAVASPSRFSVNALGQMLVAAPVALPLAEGDLSAERRVWFWNGHMASELTRDVGRTTSTAGSNLVITESAPVPFLSADGVHLYWFSNQARRLQRDGVDLSTKITWLGWRTDLSGAGRQDLASIAMPDCSCTTGGCGETCPYGDTWIPDEGVGKFFLLTLFVEGQTQAIYRSSSVYQENAGQWTATPLDLPLQRESDAANGGAILEAIPDTGCCGWSNESDDQTLLYLHGKRLTVFDELAAYKNPDYDVELLHSERQIVAQSRIRGDDDQCYCQAKYPDSTCRARTGQSRGVATHSQSFIGSTGGRDKECRGFSAALGLFAARHAGGLDQ